MTEQNQLDTELLHSYLSNMNTSVLEKMLAMYRQQADIYLNEIHQALTETNHELWVDKCHKMKGAAGSVGLKLVNQLAASMEKTTKNWEDRGADLEKLKALSQQGITEFQNWLADIS